MVEAGTKSWVEELVGRAAEEVRGAVGGLWVATGEDVE